MTLHEAMDEVCELPLEERVVVLHTVLRNMGDHFGENVAIDEDLAVGFLESAVRPKDRLKKKGGW